MEVEIRKLGTGDTTAFDQLLDVLEDVFQVEKFVRPSLLHQRNLLSRDDFFVFVALDAQHEVVGGLTAYKLEPYYTSKPLVYIFDLAVRTDLQRRGIGTQLMTAILAFGKDAGWEEVFVQADRADQHALDFYRKTTAVEEDVVHFYYPLT
jgi:aminoglycoside 3-N-acetyltransferase I